MSTASTGTAPADPFVHPALFYADAEEYLVGTVPFIQAGLAAGEPVMVAVPGDNLDRIRTALGGDAGRVRLHDMRVAGHNPGRIIPSVLLAFAAAHPGTPVRIIGEPIWAGRSELEYPACAQHEALINTAFTGRTHPLVWTATTRADSPHYRDPVTVAAGFNQPLPDPPAHAAAMTVDFAALAAVRRFVTAQAEAAGLPAERVIDLTIAVSELAANTVAHTGGDGTLAMWLDSDQVICQLTDSGHLADPMAGRIPVPPDQPTGGRGLVLVNQLCDLVRIHTGPGATTIRVHFDC
jgi:anti-sigma regulatory factor (Ser/Thr protein kinase)